MAWRTQGGIKTYDRKHYAVPGATHTACGRLRENRSVQSYVYGATKTQGMRVTSDVEIARRTVDCAQCIKATNGFK
jgi:hypothetical protein